MNILNKNEPIAEDSTKNKLLMAGSNKEDVECWDDDEDLQLDHVPLAAKAVVADDFEHDLEFPEDDAPLKLSTRDEPPRLSTNVVDEFEDWTEASLGTRHGGTGRGARSPRSSSFSAMSPSLSSSFTVESEDEGLGGLVLPEGPLNLGGLLKKRQEKTTVEKLDLTSEDQPVGEAPDQTAISADDDFFAGIDVGDGDVFDSAKPTLNRNIRHKAPGSTSSPPRGTTVNLAFLNKIQAATSRIPRLVSATDRIGSILEPVSETGAPAPSNRRPPSRLGGPSTQPMSASNIPLPSTPSRSAAAPPPTKPREMRSRPSTASLRPEPTTTSTQLLRVKRSMPAMRAAPAGPSKAPAIPPRPPTRQDHGGSRGAIPPRPKTPVDRSGAESSLGMMSRRFPFLPAGLAGAQSHHIATKGPRSVRRHESESSATAIEPPTRSVSRAGAPSRFTHRSCSPHRREGVLETPFRDAAGKRTLVQPAKRRFFGDGSELEIFDDLPTSTAAESKFIKAPVARGAPRSTRGRLGLSPLTETTNDSVPAPSTTIAAGPTAQLSEPVETPVPATPRHENTPRFARDTHASRAAREQRSGPVSGLPMPGFGGNWKAQMAVRGAVGMNMASTAPPLARVKRRRAAAQQKPHLIKPLGDNHNLAKSVKGMQYNPDTYRWEGNENALTPFDGPSPPSGHTAASSSSSLGGFLGQAPPPTSMGLGAGAAVAPSKIEMPTAQRPALITNSNLASPSVQVVGGMVFDPVRMCWLKHQQQTPSGLQSPTTSSNLHAATDDGEESDPFAGVDDLEEGLIASRNRKATNQDPQSPLSGHGSTQPEGGSMSGAAAANGAPGSTSGGSAAHRANDEWLVGEEFDVGPEFIRRQRDEEGRWSGKIGAWMGPERRADDQEWRYALRKMVAGST